MAIPTAIKQTACERLFHFHPVKTIARELGISAGAIQAWRIFIKANDFEWLTNAYVQSRKPRIYQAVKDCIAYYPIGYTELARRHGVRPSDVYREIQAYLKRSPSAKLPLRLQAWKLIGPGANGGTMTDMPERIRHMVDEYFESAKNEQELKRNIKEMFISYESLFEEVMKECKDNLKKRIAAIS